MRANIRKLLLAGVFPLVVVAMPGAAFADLGTPPVNNCTGNVPNGTYPTWDPSVTVPKTATIGNGTVVYANTTIGGYAKIGSCGAISDGIDAVHIGKSARVGDMAFISGVSSIGGSARVGNGVRIDNGTIGSGAIIGDNTNITAASAVYGSARVGSHSIITYGSSVGGGSIVGDWVLIDGVTTGSSVRLGNTNGDYTVVGYGTHIGGSSQVGYSVVYFIGQTYTGSTNTYIGSGLRTGAHVRIGRGATIGDNDSIGMYAQIYSGVVVGSGVTIGGHARICSGVVGDGMKIASYDKFGC